MASDMVDQHQSLCQVCGRGGDLLCCDTCTLVYHMECLKPPLKAIPKGIWQCPVCLDEKKSKKRKMRSPELKNRSSMEKTTMTEVEAFPKEQYSQLFSLLKHFHQENHISLSSLKQLKDLLVVADIHSMSIMLSACDLYEASEKKTYDVLFCIDTFERVYLLNFPQGFVDLDALERVKNQRRTKTQPSNGVNHSSKRRPSEPNGSVVANAGIVAAPATSTTAISQPKTHVLLQNLNRTTLKKNSIVVNTSAGDKSTNYKSSEGIEHEKQLRLPHSTSGFENGSQML